MATLACMQQSPRKICCASRHMHTACAYWRRMCYDARRDTAVGCKVRAKSVQAWREGGERESASERPRGKGEGGGYIQSHLLSTVGVPPPARRTSDVARWNCSSVGGSTRVRMVLLALLAGGRAGVSNRSTMMRLVAYKLGGPAKRYLPSRPAPRA